MRNQNRKPGKFSAVPALADCDAVLAIRPNDPAAQRQKINVLLALGRHPEARAALDSLSPMRQHADCS